MKTHTSQFKEDIKTIGKQLDSKITFEIDGVTQILTSEDLNGVTPTFQGAILKSVMKELDVDSNVDIPIGTEINYKFGVKLEGNFEYLDYGNYIVYSSEKQEDTSSYKIVCYDKLLYSMKQNEDLGITYPLSVREYINALCTKIGLEFKNKNDEFANFDRILDKELYVGLDYTYRDILDELAQVTASTICLDSEDKVEIRYINDLSEFNTVSGNDLIINDGISYPIKKIVVDGKCEQETTTGNNFLPDVIDKTQKISNGLTLTFLENNKINLKGTTPNKAIYFDMKLKETISLTKDVYVHIRNNARSGNVAIALLLNNSQKGWHSFSDINTISKLTDIKSDEFEINKIRLFVNPNQTIDITCQPSLEYTSNITEYEPYTGGKPSPNPDYPQEIKSIKGNITINISSNNEINSTTIDLQGNELCSIADIKDELVIENGNAKIIKRIGKVIYNGSEEWNKKTTLTYRTRLNSNNRNALCSHFINIPKDIDNIPNFHFINKVGNYFNLEFQDESIQTLSDFKKWLSNNNMTVYYVLATPQEIDLGQINKLKTFEGINNMTLEANLETNMTLTYANGWETIDESFLKDVNVNFGEKYGPVNSIVLSRSAESDNVYLQDEKSIEQNGLCEIKIKDNQIMNWNDRSDYLPDILEKLNGLEYYLNDFSSTGIAYLDLCDRYNIKVFDNIYSCIMFNDEMKVTQGIEEDIHTDMPDETETDYTKADKTDRRINNVSLIVDKQGQRIDALAEKVQDISNTIKGSGVITLTDCNKTPLYKLVITGDDSLLFPSSKTYPSANTFTKNSWLYVNKGESDEKIYDLKIPALRTLGNVKDEYILENTKAILIKRIGLNDNSEKYVLDEPIEIDMGTLTINLKEGTNTLQMPSFPLFSLETTYLLKNDYTDTFASTAYVNSEIEVTSDNILLESKSYTDKATEGDELISRINLDSTGNVKIEASRTVDLTGTTINMSADDVYIKANKMDIDSNGIISIKDENANNLFDTSNLTPSYQIESSISGVEETGTYFIGEKQKIFSGSRISEYENDVTIEGRNNYGHYFGGIRENLYQFPSTEWYQEDSTAHENHGVLIYGNYEGITINNSSIRYIKMENGSGSTLFSMEDGNVRCVTLTQTSLKENKKNFEKYSNALKELDNIDIYKYNLKDEKDTDKKHLGFVIGENFKYSEIVTSNDNQGVDNYSFTSLCFQMIKEQQEIINKLEKRVDDLENKLKSVIIERESDK